MEITTLGLTLAASGGLTYLLVRGTGLSPPLSRPAPTQGSPAPAEAVRWDPPSVWPRLPDPAPWGRYQKALDERLERRRPPLRPTRPLRSPGSVALTLSDYRIVLLKPPAGERVGERIRLRWTPVPLEGVTYVVEIGRGKPGGLPRLSRRPYLDVELPERGEYRWRVTARLGPERIQSPQGRFQR